VGGGGGGGGGGLESFPTFHAEMPATGRLSDWASHVTTSVKGLHYSIVHLNRRKVVPARQISHPSKLADGMSSIVFCSQIILVLYLINQLRYWQAPNAQNKHIPGCDDVLSRWKIANKQHFDSQKQLQQDTLSHTPITSNNHAGMFL